MNILIPFTMLILSWSLDSTDPAVISIIMRCFVVIHTAAFVAAAVIFYRIFKRGDSTPITVKDQMSGEMEAMTHSSYDISKLRELVFMKVGLSAVIGLYMARNYGIVYPLLLQCFNNPKTMYSSEVFRIHLRGEKEEGELSRPWVHSGMMPQWLSNIWGAASEEAQRTTAKPSRKK